MPCIFRAPGSAGTAALRSCLSSAVRANQGTLHGVRPAASAAAHPDSVAARCCIQQSLEDV
jgi:hypothetical protein